MSEDTNITDHSAPGRIRPLALCVMSQNGQYLLADGYDPVKDEQFYRPPGGGIEFGETSCEAVKREIDEEMGITLTNVHRCGVLENIFTFEGQPMHEIVFILDADPVDQSIYERDELTGRDSDGRQFTCHWVDIHTVDPDFPPIYPDGLAELLIPA
jgi:8-oxo-dGTP pyrophosphatase MutT (NUDIX family)